MPIMTYESILNRIAERTYDNTRQLRKGVNQRRNGMEDLYGVMFSAEGDANNPATFFISLSPDFVYLQRFAFKFVIRPYTTTVQGGTDSAVVDVKNTNLSVSNDAITPNPHSHGTEPHTHNLITGKSFVQTTSDYWRMKIAGIDITPELMEQHDGDWIDMTDETGYKVFPNKQLDGREDFYDILDVCVLKMMQGEEEEVEQILKPEFKRVEIISDAPFGVDAYLYVKYSNLNR